MCMMLSARVFKPCMLLEFCEHTAWTMPHYRRYRSIIAKLTYASRAWWGYTSATDRQRLKAIIRRSDRSGFVPANLPTFEELCLAADEKLFETIIWDNNHVLHKFLPPQSETIEHYDLRQPRHNFSLPARNSHLADSNFIQRMSYLDVYWLTDVLFTERELRFTFAICCRPSVCRLSVVCNARAPYSASWNFWQFSTKFGTLVIH